MVPLSQMAPAARAARVAQLVRNPATRAAVPTQYLPAKYRTMRAQNLQGAQPIVPGSGITNKQLNQMTLQAQQVKYGPAEQQLGQQLQGAQQTAKDVPQWYQGFVNDLRTHAANVQANDQQAQQQMQGYAGAIRGLDQQNLNTVQQANQAQSAVTGAQPSAQTGQDASNASTVRQALLAGLGTMMASTGKADNNYADTLAHVVGPIQGMQASARAQGNVKAVQGKQQSLAQDKGAYGQQYQAQTKADEGKNVLAQQALGISATKAQTSAKTAAQRLQETTRHNKAAEQNVANNPTRQKTQAELDFYNKHHYWPPTGPPKPAKGANGKSPYLNTNQQSNAWGQVEAASKMLQTLQKAHPGQDLTAYRQYFESGGSQHAVDKAGNPYSVKYPKTPGVLFDAALELANTGRLSQKTVKALHTQGYQIKGRYPTGPGAPKPPKVNLGGPPLSPTPVPTSVMPTFPG